MLNMARKRVVTRVLKGIFYTIINAILCPILIARVSRKSATRSLAHNVSIFTINPMLLRTIEFVCLSGELLLIANYTTPILTA